MIDQLIHNYLFLLLMIPPISTVLVYYVSVFFFRHRWKAIHFSVQGTALFYVIAVTLLLEKLFGYNFIGIILIILISVLAVILIIQWKSKTEVILRNGLKIVARISFLVFALLYILLISYEIIQYIYKS